MSLLVRGVVTHSLLVLAFAVIYAIYTYHIHDDYGLQRDHPLDTFVSALFLSAFVGAGSFPANVEHTSSFSRLILICNVLTSSLTTMWLIAAER